MTPKAQPHGSAVVRHTNTEETCGANQQSTTEDSSVVKKLQFFTIAWMTVELVIGLTEGIRARSVSLSAFGADSAVELLSALVVLQRFRIGPNIERKAARVSSILLYLLALYIVTSSTFSLIGSGFHAEASRVGIVMLVAAAILMPILGAAKRRFAEKTGSAALKADSAQTRVCAYMAWIALAGLLVNAAFHLQWADSLAAFFLVPLVLREANEARKGEICGCSS